MNSKQSPDCDMSAESPLPLQGQCALITGAAKRIGATIARRLHAAGADIAIHYRSSAEDANQLGAKLNELRPDSAKTFSANIGESTETLALIDDVLSWHSNLGILINNASSFFPTPLGTINDASWTDLMESNLKGPMFLSQAASDSLRRSKGCIVNIIDIHARRPLKNHIVYGSAKAGLAMLTKSLAKELAPDIRVNGVSPGAIAWPENGMTDDIKQSIVQQIPLGRTGEPGDIADCVIFLVCDATYTSGCIVSVDGGRSLGW